MTTRTRPGRARRRRRAPGDLAAPEHRGARLQRHLPLTLARLQTDGPARISDLARLEGVTQPAMSGLVNRLESDGLVTRAADPTDARAALVALTDPGRAFAEIRRAERSRVLASRVERLSDADRAAIRAALPALDRLSNLTDA